MNATSQSSDTTCGRSRKTRTQLIRFLVIGCTSVMIDAVVYWLLVHQADLQLDVSKGISYFAGMIFGFFGNKFWTFGSNRKSLTEPIIYIILYGITFGVNIACNRLCLNVLDGLTEYEKPVAFLFATGVTTVLNFIGMKWVTFRKGVTMRTESQLQAVD